MLTFGCLVRFCLTFEKDVALKKILTPFRFRKRNTSQTVCFENKMRNSFLCYQVLLPVWPGPKSGRGICNPRMSCCPGIVNISWDLSSCTDVNRCQHTRISLIYIYIYTYIYEWNPHVCSKINAYMFGYVNNPLKNKMIVQFLFVA